MSHRRIVIGDIHGCPKTLNKLLLFIFCIGFTFNSLNAQELVLESSNHLDELLDYSSDLLLSEIKKNSNNPTKYVIPKSLTDTSFIKLGFLPYFNFNRVEGFNLGINPEIEINNSSILFAKGTYSTHLDKYFGEVGFKQKLINDKDFKLIIGAKGFSEVISQTNDKSFSKFENSLTSMIFASDYYDYVRKDGYEIFLNSKYKNLKIDGFYTYRRNSGFETKTDTLLPFLDFASLWNTPRKQAPRQWDLYRSIINYSDNNFMEIENLTTNINAILSYGFLDNDSYNSFDFSIKLKYPLFSSNINSNYKSYLTILTEFGSVTENAPRPHTFRLKSRNIAFTPFGNFATAPIGIYGGNDYNTLHFRYNTTDLIFRGLGLKNENANGIELLFLFSAASYRSNLTFMKAMGNDVYSEVGLGLGRIPSILSDNVDIEIILSAGLGNLANGRYGITLSLN